MFFPADPSTTIIRMVGTVVGDINPAFTKEHSFLWIPTTVYPVDHFFSIIFHAIQSIERRVRLISDMKIPSSRPPTPSMFMVIAGPANIVSIR